MNRPEDIRPDYYGGEANPYEVIKAAEEWGWGYEMCMGTALKYVSRCGKKESEDPIKDLTKARWYVDRATKNRPGHIRKGQGVTSSMRPSEFAQAHALDPELAQAVMYLRQNDPETALVFITAALEGMCEA